MHKDAKTQWWNDRSSLLRLAAAPFLFLIGFGLLPLHAQSGSVDLGFDPGTGVDLSVYGIALQTNGQILICGDFTSVDDVERVNVARLNANGSRDDSFDTGSALGGAFPSVYAMALQASGKAIIGGSFTSAVTTNLARLNTNGSLDNTFTAQADDTVNALTIQTDGSVLIGGFFTHVNGQARSGIARLNSNGVLDGSFNPSLAGAFAAVYALAVQNDGKIIVCGSFTNVNGTQRTNIARLNSSGSLDTNFAPVSIGGGQFSLATFYSVAIDAQGGVVVGGDFMSVNGLVRTNLARFNSEGSVDLTFSPAAGTDFAVNSVALEKYGRILIAGYFETVNGASQNYIARLNSDGSRDASFSIGSGASDVIYSVALQGDGKVLIGGAFTEFNLTGRSGICRLLNVVTVSPPKLFNPVFSNHVFRASVATVSGKSYLLEFKSALSNASWSVLPSVAGDGTTKVLTDPSATDPRRFYRVEVQ